MTAEQRKATIEALLNERRGYETHGQTDRIKDVDAELKRLGAEGEKPSARAEKRPAGRSKASTRSKSSKSAKK